MLTRHLQGRTGPRNVLTARAVTPRRHTHGGEVAVRISEFRQYGSVELVTGASPWVVDRLRAAGCVFAEDEARLLVSAARTPADLVSMVDRRAAGEPVEHVVGWAEFCGQRIAVDPGVFVPRRRTEFLVHEAAARAQPGAIVVDVCCGSGAVGAALIASLSRVELHAVDIDPAAVLCARRNVVALGGLVYEGDLYDPLPSTLWGRVDVLVANAPYVPTEEIALLPPEARVYEPHDALDGGADGLDVQRRVIEAAPGWLAPGGHLLIETSERQSPQTVDMVAGSGLIPRVAHSDALDATVVIGTRRVGYDRPVAWA
jgi:release factor glutamine methyltransferase